MPLNQPQQGFSRRTLLVLLCGSVAFLGWYSVNFAMRLQREAVEREFRQASTYRLNGSEPATVRMRKQLLREIGRGRGFGVKGDGLVTIPEARERLGDRAFGFIFVADDSFTPADVDRFKQAFPEAEVNYTSRENVERVRRDVRDN